VKDEGPFGVIDDYASGACDCGRPHDDSFYVSEADDPGRGEDDGSGVWWLIHTACRTRWYGGRGARDDDSEAWRTAPSEPVKLRRYREVSGETPAWVGEVGEAKLHALFRLCHEAAGRDHIGTLCDGCDHRAAPETMAALLDFARAAMELARAATLLATMPEETVATLLDLARAGHQEDFTFLLRSCNGRLSAALLEHAWKGTRRRLGLA